MILDFIEISEGTQEQKKNPPNPQTFFLEGTLDTDLELRYGGSSII